MKQKEGSSSSSHHVNTAMIAGGGGGGGGCCPRRIQRCSTSRKSFLQLNTSPTMPRSPLPQQSNDEYFWFVFAFEINNVNL
ncbi:hypothetical protein BLA29_011474 [Euroglyphus maynei]|uniref:Uncharacterized protein n=1 Tax=Euroglyphus maynei TaxID=6958 RepID=A0A1Y3BBK2_EURMA|nr:hypothetical protein BLA29_011474 [Euroglyphus maynei]